MTTFHHQDRTADGIAASFAHAGYAYSREATDAVAALIAEAGSWDKAYGRFSSRLYTGKITEAQGLLADLPYAESHADDPELALACIWPDRSRPVDPRFADRAARLIARIYELRAPALAEAA
jgi:hypothetical protein